MGTVATPEPHAADAVRLPIFHAALHGMSLSALDDGRIVEVNEAWCRIFGFERDEVVGRTADELGLWVDGSVRRDFYERLREDRTIPLAILEGRRRDGEVRQIEATAQTLEIDGLGYVFGTVRDVTDRLAVEGAFRESQERFRALAEATTEGIAVHIDGRILFANRALAGMLGYDESEMVGRSVLDFAAPASREAVLEAVRSGRTEPYEAAALRKDGSEVPVEVIAQHTDLAGQLVRVSVLRDLTERRRAEKALAESERRFRALIETSSDAFLLVDGDATVMYQSPAAERLFGFSLDEAASLASSFGLVHPADRETAQLLFAEVVGEPGGSRSGEYRVRSKDGYWRWVEAVATNLLSDPAVEAVVVNVRDVTERKQAEDKARESAARLEALVGSIDEIVFEFDADGTYLNVWTRNEDLLAAPRDELLGRRIVDVLGEEGGLPFVETMNRVIATGVAETIEYPLDVGAGTRWFLGRVSRIDVADDHPPTVAFLARDVTDAKRAEQALRAAEARYRSLVETIPAVVYLDQLDPTSSSIYVSPQAEEVFGYPLDEWRADPVFWTRLVHPDDHGWVLARQEELTRGPRPFSMEYRMIASDGRVLWVRDEAVPVTDETGTPLYWQGFWLDITERKEADEALREAEERYRLVVESSRDVISLFDLEGRYTFVSPSIERVLGFRPMELVGRSGFDQIHPDDLATAREALQRILSGEPVEVTEIRVRHRDGRWVHFEGTAVPVLGADGAPYQIVATSRDITDRKAAEEERQRLLGRLVAAQEEERARIAVDIHDDSLQVMTAVALRVGKLRQRLGDDAELLKVEDTVERAIERLRHLLFELHPPALDREGVAGAIRDYVRSWRDETGDDVVLQIRDRTTQEQRADLRAACYRIAQEALANVRKHARASRVEVELETVDGGTLVRVADDGVGVPGELTTSPPGHLGLSAMRERAELVGGWCRVGPREGGGTVVEFWLPNETGGGTGPT
jgi:PAS domain S-box-containing protein